MREDGGIRLSDEAFLEIKQLFQAVRTAEDHVNFYLRGLCRGYGIDPAQHELRGREIVAKAKNDDQQPNT